MNRTLLLILLLLVRGQQDPTVAQTKRPDIADTLRQLITMSVPTPAAETASGETEKPTRLPSFFDENKPPADEAPFDDLLDYWTEKANQHRSVRPTEKVRQRLLEGCITDPERLAVLVRLMPANPNIARSIKQLFDAAQSDQRFDEQWHQNVKEWLTFNSTYFLNDLVLRVQKVKETKYGSVDQADALAALARVDWESAEPFLRSLAESGTPRIATLALTLFYRHAIAENDSAAMERYRNSLKGVAADRNQGAWARDKAIETLSLSEWSGRDDWYLGLFEDETLVDPTEGQYLFSPLTTLFATDPEKWIPVMARLTESKNVATRSGAAKCLLTFQNQRARKDALRPLLPWLSNPNWASNRFDHRLRLIQSMENIDLPESVPGLIWVVENDESSSNRTYAAQSLGRYGDPRAVPALKRALSREKEEDDIQRLIRGLLASQGITEQEQLEAIEAYALKTLTPDGLAELSPYRRNQSALSVPLSIGKYLVTQGTTNEAVVRAVLRRADALKENNQPLAEVLLKLVHQWGGRQIDLDLIHRIGNGSASAEAIGEALGRGSKLRESLELELRGLLAESGSAQGIAAVLLDDSSFAQSILSSDVPLAQIALLASSRLTRTSLPVPSIKPLLRSKNELLVFAAERYLMAEDTKEAREALWQHHPNEAFVAGWRETIQYLEESYAVMDEVEKELRGELFKDGGPTETYALISNHAHYKMILRVYNDRVVYTLHEDPSRHLERIVSKVELASFKDIIAESGIEDRGPVFESCHHNCSAFEFLRLTKDRGRRVFSMSALSGEWGSVWENFMLLSRGDNAKTHYSLEKEIKGLEILFAGDKLSVQDVWTNGSEVRIFVERAETEAEQEERHKFQREPDEEETEFARVERKRRVAAKEKARFSWRTLVNGKADRLTTQPQGYETFDETRFSLLLERNQNSVQVLSADAIVVTRNFDGLWKQVANTKAVSLSTEGAYSNPVVTPDGTWVVAAKAERDWGAPNYVVRYNLRTGREFRVRLEPASVFTPVAFVPVHGKVLLRRAKDDYDPASTSVGPHRPEYHLLDAETGETQLVTGVFAPIREEGKRSLQPTGNPNEFWAAISDEEKNQTQVGRYNLKDFSFKSMLTFPHISFESMSMWVDAKSEKVYLVYKGQLLRLPFNPD